MEVLTQKEFLLPLRTLQRLGPVRVRIQAAVLTTRMTTMLTGAMALVDMGEVRIRNMG